MTEPIAVFETYASIATPCIDVDLPGYLILRPKTVGTRLKELPAFATELGRVAALLEEAICEVTTARQLYFLRFSEAQATVHFHLFPRTDALTAAYAEAFPQRGRNVIGPELFEWARQTYRTGTDGRLSQGTVSASDSIRRLLAGWPNPS